MKNNHWIWMLIGCGLPLLLIFLAPSFGIGGGSSLFIFIIFMFACHLFMPHGSHRHGGHNHSQHKQNDETKNGKKAPSAKAEEQHKGHKH
ncbi:hypothetical protein SAMN04487989_101187 [Bizionia echini]|jgi:hypothetical protein|uniref:DUF2933 domain-containing protein n=1 Tax=Bizionia echini TaxID=649333 RepID=A0A1I4YPR8_9FLAO|nr:MULTISPECIES: hypothetical protein [Flavobacteriaceae]SFN40028.1 hypothetical protein SAMN04487989_101187 [Bizionia echini]